MNKEYFDVYNVSIRLNTSLDRFAKFVLFNYIPFRESENQDINIDVTYSKKAGEYAVEQKSTLRRFGDGMYVDSNSILWENEYGFRVFISLCHDGSMQVHAFHQDLLGKSDEEERLKDFQRSMRWAIHFPLFTWLQYRRGWSLIHSSAVVKDNEALVFCGLNKVGKSTLSVYLSDEYGYDLMTDNFLLIGDHTVYGFPEVIRLSPEAAERMGLASIWENPVYGKYHVDPETIGTELQATPVAFFMISQGNNLETNELDAKTTWETMRNLHSYLGEFPEHSYLGMWPYITGEQMNTETATRTITTTPWYELSYEPNWDLDTVVSEIKRCI